MDQIAATLIGLAVGIALGATGFWLVVRGRPAQVVGEHPALVEARHSTAVAEIRAEEATLRAELTSRLAAVDATEKGLRDRLRDQETQFDELVERHKQERAAQDERDRRERAAQEVRDRAERVAREERERAESKVLQVLTPVQETLRSMQSKVAELETQRHLQHGELSEQLRSAAESEERLRSTADSLSAALKSNSTRGVWGETQLRTVVEAAGLLQRVNFDVQSSIVTDRGTGRPDMVINLPGGKTIAVDAKVPFNSYIEANAIPVTADESSVSQRGALMKKHVKAVRDHITALGGKAYWEGLDSSPEMVIAFIPSESLLSSALESDPTILEFAFSKRVALASPVTLFSVLKTVAVSWQHAVVTEEAKSLFDISRELYSRLSTMAGHVEKLGRSVKATVNDYNKFVGSLERQVLPSARKLNQLDESKVLGALEGVEESPRGLTAPELLAPELHATTEESDERGSEVGTGRGSERDPDRSRRTAIAKELGALDELGVARGQLDTGAIALAGLEVVRDGEEEDRESA